jgi:hypothetical protein
MKETRQAGEREGKRREKVASMRANKRNKENWRKDKH